MENTVIFTQFAQNPQVAFEIAMVRDKRLCSVEKSNVLEVIRLSYDHRIPS